MKGASLRISPLSIMIVTLVLGGAVSARAEDTIPMAEGETVIEAKTYDVRTIRPSRSGRVYLFEKFESDLPEIGKLILLREGDAPVMAFRVLKTYPETLRIAAKKLLVYTGFPKLGRGSQYRAFEKTGEFAVAPVPPTPQDLEDLRDLEELPPPPEDGEVGSFSVPMEETLPLMEAPFENEPMSEPSADSMESLEELPPEEPLAEPNPESEWADGADLSEAPQEFEQPNAEQEGVDPFGSAQEPPFEENVVPEIEEAASDEEVSEGDFTVEGVELKGVGEFEEYRFYYPNQVTLALGFFPHKKTPGPSIKFSGGILYSRKLSRNWALEGGAFYYKSGGNWQGQSGITMTVVPVLGTIQYHSYLSEVLSFYFYGGFSYSYVASSVGAPVRLLQQVQTPSLAAGAGLLLQTGPNWYLRANLGVDSLLFGAALRF